MPKVESFIDITSSLLVANHDIDTNTLYTILNIFDKSYNDLKKLCKDKKINKDMRKNESQKQFKWEGENVKGKNDKKLRIAYNKVTKIVRRVNPSIWTNDAKQKFYKKYPELIYYDDPKKEKKKKTKKAKTPQKAKTTPKAKTPQKVKTQQKVKIKKDISTFDLIASLVAQANNANGTTNNEKIKEKKKEKETKKEVTKKNFFQKDDTKSKTKNQPKKKVKKKFKKTAKVLVKENITVREFQHKDLTKTQYIDESNNIWNDKHEQIGFFNEEDDIVTLLS